MSPGRTGGKESSFEIRRRFKGIGQIRRSAGTTSVRVYRQRVALIEKLFKLERYEHLRAFRDGRISIEELVEAENDERLGVKLSDLALSENLWAAAERVLQAELPREVSNNEQRGRRRTIRRYIVSFFALQRKARKYLGPDARVSDLEHVPWTELGEGWETSAADWMHMKRAVSHFLTQLLDDKFHPFARRIRSRIPNKKPNKRKPNLSVERFVELLEHVPAHAARAYWVLAVSGMRNGEYLDCGLKNLRTADRVLLVPGSEKNDLGHVELQFTPDNWARIVAGVPSPLRYRMLWVHWTRACKIVGIDVNMHDLRHCAGQWAHDNGVLESDVQAFLRHETAGMTRDYILRDTTLRVSVALDRAIAAAAKPKLKRQA